jgi:hypothetical protein
MKSLSPKKAILAKLQLHMVKILFATVTKHREWTDHRDLIARSVAALAIPALFRHIGPERSWEPRNWAQQRLSPR